LNVISRD